MKITIVTLIFIVTFASCSDDPETPLPAETQKGENTFGAIINGQVMIPKNSIGYQPPGNSHYAVRYFTSPKYEEISARTNMGGVYIYIQNITKTYPLPVDNYIIGNSNGEQSDSFAENTLITADVYDNNGNLKTYLSIADTGNINITRDDVFIISGTFSCKLKCQDNPNDIIEIKEGRFDFNKSSINSTNFK